MDPPETKSENGSAAVAPEPQAKKEIEWNDALELLLCNEAEKCAGLSWLHSRSDVLFSRRANWLQIPMIVLSTVSGAISVGSEQLFGNSQFSSVAIGGVSILVGILGTLNSYFALSKRSEGHRLGATQYSLIHRAIMIEMSLPRNQRTIPKVMLKMVKDELKRLQEILPRVSDDAIAEYKRVVMPKTEGVEHPDILGDMHAIHPYDETAVQEVLRVKHKIVHQAQAMVPVSPSPPETALAIRVPGATAVEV